MFLVLLRGSARAVADVTRGLCPSADNGTGYKTGPQEAHSLTLALFRMYISSSSDSVSLSHAYLLALSLSMGGCPSDQQDQKHIHRGKVRLAGVFSSKPAALCITEVREI